MLQVFGIVIVIISVSCSQPQVSSIGAEIPSIMADSSRVGELTRSAGRGALLLTRFRSFAELKSVVRIDYEEATPFHSAPCQVNPRWCCRIKVVSKK